MLQLMIMSTNKSTIFVSVNERGEKKKGERRFSVDFQRVGGAVFSLARYAAILGNRATSSANLRSAGTFSSCGRG